MPARPGAGRKSNFDEKVRNNVIEKCWAILHEQLNDPEISAAIKRDIALRVCPKTIPTELTGGIGVAVTAMGTIEKIVDGVKTELHFNIGSKPAPDEPPDPS
jgi:hypothetical protein